MVELIDVSLAAARKGSPRLDHITLRIEAGEVVALIGPSGAGKTSLLDVLLGLTEPDSGRIARAGERRSYPPAACRPVTIAAVLQGDRVHAQSALSNICGFDPVPDFDRVVEAARLAGVDPSIRALPLGYDTVLAPGGAPLSGGERQRLLLARALYRRPHMLVLDEATSELDAAAESAMLETLRSSGLTLLLVTHRRETLDAVDRVLQMANGRIVARRAGGRSRSRSIMATAHQASDALATTVSDARCQAVRQ